jgi:hypothetical protein
MLQFAGSARQGGAATIISEDDQRVRHQTNKRDNLSSAVNY